MADQPCRVPVVGCYGIAMLLLSAVFWCLQLPLLGSNPQALPMRVEFMTEVGKLNTLILKFLDLDMAEGTTSWELADVKANQAVKGRSLSKKQRAQRYTIPVAELERVRIYVDF